MMHVPMISDRDVYASAQLLVEKHGADSGASAPIASFPRMDYAVAMRWLVIPRVLVLRMARAAPRDQQLSLLSNEFIGTT